MTKRIMIQGTMSGVGKSLITGLLAVLAARNGKKTAYPMWWGYNADFIPTRQNSGRYVYHRTEKAVTVHIKDSFYNHVHYDSDTMDIHETHAIREKYCLPSLNIGYMNIKNAGDAYRYFEDITRRNIPFIGQRYIGEILHYQKWRFADRFLCYSLCSRKSNGKSFLFL